MISPRVIDHFVFWNVRECDMEGAMSHIRQRVDGANAQYSQYLLRQAELAARARQEFEAGEARLQAARDKLRHPGP